MIATNVVTWDAGISLFGGLATGGGNLGGKRGAQHVNYSKQAAAGNYAAVDFVDTDVGTDWVERDFALAGSTNSPGLQTAGAGSLVMREIEPRLRQLQSQFIDDHGQEILQASIFALRALLASTPGLRKPLLSAEPSGRLIATWRRGTDSLSLRLMRAVEIHFAFGGAARSGRNDTSPRYGRSTAATFFAESSEARQIAA